MCAGSVDDLRFSEPPGLFIVGLARVPCAFGFFVRGGGDVVVAPQEVLSPPERCAEQRHGLASTSWTLQNTICSGLQCLDELRHELALQEWVRESTDR